MSGPSRPSTASMNLGVVASLLQVPPQKGSVGTPKGSAEKFSRKASQKGGRKKKKLVSFPAACQHLPGSRRAREAVRGDGVERGGEAAAADRGVVRGARRRRQAAAPRGHGRRGVLPRLLQRLRPLRLPRHRLQVRRDGLRRQGTSNYSPSLPSRFCSSTALAAFVSESLS